MWSSAQFSEPKSDMQAESARPLSPLGPTQPVKPRHDQHPYELEVGWAEPDAKLYLFPYPTRRPTLPYVPRARSAAPICG